MKPRFGSIPPIRIPVDEDGLYSWAGRVPEDEKKFYREIFDGSFSPELEASLPPTCPYCKKEASLHSGDEVYQGRSDLAEKNFWVCWPCNARVGCHKDTALPLGTLANAETRWHRKEAHRWFDALWKGELMTLPQAYRWLIKELGVAPEDAHIGRFTTLQCEQLIHAVKLLLAPSDLEI